MTVVRVKTTAGWQDLQKVGPQGPEGPPGPVSSVAIEPWREVGAAGQPAFQNGWSSIGGVFSPVGFRKRPDGRVELRGMIQNGTSAVAFTLPVGYRPPSIVSLVAVSVGPVITRVDCNPDGTVYSYMTGAAKWVSLDGMEFATDQTIFPAGLAGPPRLTALPGAAVDGQEVVYVADAANGVLWHLRYNAAQTRWEFVGGPPLRYFATGNLSGIAMGSGWQAVGFAPASLRPPGLDQASGNLGGRYGFQLSGRFAANGTPAPSTLILMDQRSTPGEVYRTHFDLGVISLGGSTYQNMAFETTVPIIPTGGEPTRLQVLATAGSGNVGQFWAINAVLLVTPVYLEAP